MVVFARNQQTGYAGYTDHRLTSQASNMRALKNVAAVPLLFLLAIAIAPATTAAQPIDLQKATPDGSTLWYDGKDLLVEGKGWTDVQSFYDRLPAKAHGQVPGVVWDLSHDSAGLCVRFITDAPEIKVRWTVRGRNLAMPHMPATGVSGIDLYVKQPNAAWRFLGNGRPLAVSDTASFAVPPNSECLLYLPLYNGTASLQIGIPKDRHISKPDSSSPKRPCVVWYGTSITQGGCASRPGMAATAIVGRRLDAEIMNLGFSGSARMEPEIADLLAELNPSVFVLDPLANMSPEMVAERVEPFVKKLRAAHPDTPILLAEDASVYNVSPTEKGRILRDVVNRLAAAGVKNLHVLSNRGMLGHDGEATVDGCHPTDLGMMRQAEVFTQAIKPLLKPPVN
jgi:hypothetical protein